METSFFFARPYHSCDRGLNGHTNGLIREYFPKEKAFEEISDAHSTLKCNNRKPERIIKKRSAAIE